MAIDPNNRSRLGDRVRTNSGMGSVLGVVGALAIIAVLFFAFYDGNETGTNSPGTSTQTTAPEKSSPTPSTPK